MCHFYNVGVTVSHWSLWFTSMNLFVASLLWELWCHFLVPWKLVLSEKGLWNGCLFSVSQVPILRVTASAATNHQMQHPLLSPAHVYCKFRNQCLLPFLSHLITVSQPLNLADIPCSSTGRTSPQTSSTLSITWDPVLRVVLSTAIQNQEQLPLPLVHVSCESLKPSPHGRPFPQPPTPASIPWKYISWPD